MIPHIIWSCTILILAAAAYTLIHRRATEKATYKALEEKLQKEMEDIRQQYGERALQEINDRLASLELSSNME